MDKNQLDCISVNEIEGVTITVDGQEHVFKKEQELTTLENIGMWLVLFLYGFLECSADYLFGLCYFHGVHKERYNV